MTPAETPHFKPRKTISRPHAETAGKAVTMIKAQTAPTDAAEVAKIQREQVRGDADAR